MLDLGVDHHTHSTFSDGRDTPLRNIQAARARGLHTLCFSDHVRRDSDYLGEYVETLGALRERFAPLGLALKIGVEAKILDADGTLDLPEGCEALDFVAIADHQLPLGDRCVGPRQVREALASGELTGAQVVDALTRSTCNAIARVRTPHLAHLYSFLPKVGLDESLVTEAHVSALADRLRVRAGSVEVSERWRCPSLRVVRLLLRHGVRVVASTDAHHAHAIGKYDFVQKLNNMLISDEIFMRTA